MRLTHRMDNRSIIHAHCSLIKNNQLRRMTVLCFLHSMAYVISHHAQFLQMLTGNRRELSRAT